MRDEIPFPESSKAVLTSTVAFVTSDMPAIAEVMETPNAA